jgi:hypothetical protein
MFYRASWNREIKCCSFSQFAFRPCAAAMASGNPPHDDFRRMLVDLLHALRSASCKHFGWIAMPELGGDIEVIDTATPRTTYDLTRRKLGMVGGLAQTSATVDLNLMNCQTSLLNVFRVGDTSCMGGGIAAVTHAARLLANQLTK